MIDHALPMGRPEPGHAQDRRSNGQSDSTSWRPAAGDDDPIVPLINGRILARCIPRARLHVIAGGGHLFLLEQPAEIARLSATFLRGEPPRSRPA